MPDKKSGSNDDSGEERDYYEVAVPSRGLCIHHHREIQVAETKHPCTTTTSSTQSPFDPRTISCDALYSGEVPISSLSPTLCFPEEVTVVDGEIGGGRERAGDRDGEHNSSKWGEREGRSSHRDRDRDRDSESKYDSDDSGEYNHDSHRRNERDSGRRGDEKGGVEQDRLHHHHSSSSSSRK